MKTYKFYENPELKAKSLTQKLENIKTQIIHIFSFVFFIINLLHIITTTGWQEKIPEECLYFKKYSASSTVQH